MEGVGFHESSRGFLAERNAYTNSNCRPLLEWISSTEGCWVLCGAPGTGKSGAIHQFIAQIQNQEPETAILAWNASAIAYQGNFDPVTNNRCWKEAKEQGRKILVIIDAFDQKRMDGGIPFDSLAAHLSANEDLSNVRLILGCRAADWDPSGGQYLLDLWKREKDAPHVLEICPLRRADILRACDVAQIDKASFIEAIFSKRLDALAHWPLTLNSLLEEFFSTGQLPNVTGALLSRTIDRLLLEMDSRKKGHNESLFTLKQLSRRVAALTLLGGFQAATRENYTPNMLTVEKFISVPALAQDKDEKGSVFEVSARGFDELIGTALFTPVHPPSETDKSPALGFTHQSYAEYLAAEYLQYLKISQLQSLLLVPVHGEELVPGPLVEVAAWLAAIRSDWFDCLSEHCPQILLRADGNAFSDSQKLNLIDSLLNEVTRLNADVFHEIKRLTPAFDFSGLSEKLKPVILDRKAHSLVRRFAFQVAEQCCLASLENCLWEFLERTDDLEPRPWCITALYDILRFQSLSPLQIEQLKRAMRGELGPDDDDELKGIALLLLVPSHLSAKEVSAWLSIRKKKSLYGGYWAFLEHVLPNQIMESDVETMLKLGTVTPSIFHCDFGHSKLGYSVLKKFGNLSRITEETRAVFIEWVLKCASRNYSLPYEIKKEDENEIISEDQRLDWLEIVVNHASINNRIIDSVIRALGLQWPSLDWTLSKIAAAPEEKQPIWAEVCSWAVLDEQEREKNLPMLLDAYSRFPVMRSALKPCRDGMNIHESYIADRKEARAKYKDSFDEPEKSSSSQSRRERLDKYFSLYAEGRTFVWLHLWKSIMMEDESYMGSREIFKSKGWCSLSEGERVIAKSCAKTFLLIHDDPRRKSDDWYNANYSQAAELAINLLAPTFAIDAPLAEAVSIKWIGCWVRETISTTEEEQSAAALLYPLNPQDFLDVLYEKFIEENEENKYCQKIELLNLCWNDELSEIFARWLSDSSMRPETFRTGFQFLSSKNIGVANDLAELWLNRLDRPECVLSKEMIATIRFCGLIFTNGVHFDRVYKTITSDQIALGILEQGAMTFGYGGRESSSLVLTLTAQHLGQLYAIMARLFPVRDRLIDSGSEGLVTYSDMLDDATNMIEGRYAAVASPEELELMSSQLSESRKLSLAFARSRALRVGAESSWKPVSPEVLLRLVHRQHACFLRTNADLLNFVVGRLEAFQKRPWDICIQPLWNEPHQATPTPKHENTLANALKRWLDDSLELVVNREVQPIEIIPHRLDLKIDVPGDPPLNVIVEVKKAENVDAATAMQTQLVDDYLARGGFTHGVYLVAWFEPGKSKIPGHRLDEIEQQLQILRSSLTLSEHMSVEAIVLDCRYRRQNVADSGL